MAVTVINLVNPNNNLVYTCTPEEAVIAAFAQARGDFNTWDYAARYGHLVIRGEHTVACGDFCTFIHPEDMMACSITYLAEYGSHDRMVVSALVKDTHGKVLLNGPVAEVTEIDSVNPLVSFKAPIGLKGIKKVVKLIDETLQAGK